MQLRLGIAVCSFVLAIAAMSGCATGGGNAAQQTFMEKCTSAAKTEEQRSACAWENASRMASGR